MTTPKRPRGRPRLPADEIGRMRSLRVPDDLWERARARAEDEGIDLSEWVRDAMEDALTRTANQKETA
jgi:predicted HicB family RNase H-like nuclease